MGSVFEDISKALDSTLKGGGLNMTIVLENDKYTPDLGTAYLSSFNLPAPVSPSTLGPTGKNVHEGIYQVDINYPAFSGRSNLLKKADQIKDVFKHGLDITWGAHTVRIQESSISGIRVNGGWAVLNVSINWSTHTARG